MWWSWVEQWTHKLILEPLLLCENRLSDSVASVVVQKQPTFLTLMCTKHGKSEVIKDFLLLKKARFLGTSEFWCPFLCAVLLFEKKLVLEWTVQCSRTVWFFVMFDMFEVQIWTKMWCSEVFEVQSCCYATRLGLELTVSCSRTVWFFVMFDTFEVWFWAKMWCSESSMFGHSMFGVFEVRYFGVRSKTNRVLSPSTIFIH